ncbi:hypothetical protein [Prochlorococcus marinus]|uniref:hypothetical protein n=1 Tax=Prochlorococcus marinus TaxID=1219 RepID=UPI0002FB183C|nr:hypothetical protein [Prochlorococcus marinus]
MARGVQEDDLVVSDHSALDCWLQLSICSSTKGGLMVSEWHFKPFLPTDQVWKP